MHGEMFRVMSLEKQSSRRPTISSDYGGDDVLDVHAAMANVQLGRAADDTRAARGGSSQAADGHL